MASRSSKKEEAGVVVKGVTRIAVTVQGTRPLLMDYMSDEEIENGLIRGQRKPKRTDLTRDQLAEEGLYPQVDGRYGLPVEMLFACIRDAGTLVKFDAKRNISTGKSTLMPSFLEIEEQFLPFAEDAEWVSDLRRGTNPKDGVAVGIVRPKFKDWGFTFHIKVDTQLVTEETVRRLIELAGRANGLGSWRPARKGNFGQFAIADWVVLERDGKAVNSEEASGNGSVSEAARVGVASMAVLSTLKLAVLSLLRLF